MKENKFFIWEEKNLTEPKRKLEPKLTSGQSGGINEIKSVFVKNECEDIGNKKVWKRNCPKCGEYIFYSNKYLLERGKKRKSLCKMCNDNFRKENPQAQPFYGKHHTNVNKQKMLEGNKRFKRTEKYLENLSVGGKKAWKNPEIRKKYINALLQTKFLGRRCDKGQPELIEKWNRLGFNFKLNYPLHINQVLFYIDGYDKEKNVILEYDSLYHNKPGRKEKDLVRQNKIIEILKPKKFWRYNSKTKQIKNVLENYG
jgi:hypothetical protein